MNRSRLDALVNLIAVVNVDILNERYRQIEKRGFERHTYGEWLSIIGEEHGESCQAINRLLFPGEAKPTDASNLYDELIQTAACYQAFAEQVKQEMQEAEQGED